MKGLSTAIEIAAAGARYTCLECNTTGHPGAVLVGSRNPPYAPRCAECWRREERMLKEQVRVGVAVFIRREGKLLLMQRSGSHGAGSWALPGGHVEYGEDPYNTAKREVMEETGLTVTSITCHNIPWASTVFAEQKHYITLFFDAECEGEPKNLEPEKCMALDWFQEDKLPQPLFGALGSLFNE